MTAKSHAYHKLQTMNSRRAETFFLDEIRLRNRIPETKDILGPVNISYCNGWVMWYFYNWPSKTGYRYENCSNHIINIEQSGNLWKQEGKLPRRYRQRAREFINYSLDIKASILLCAETLQPCAGHSSAAQCRAVQLLLLILLNNYNQRDLHANMKQPKGTNPNKRQQSVLFQKGDDGCYLFTLIFQHIMKALMAGCGCTLSLSYMWDLLL